MNGHRLGRQVLSELCFCDHNRLNDKSVIDTLLIEAARDAGATLISVHVHHFQPYGLSGVAILAESHLTVHTWPELGYAAVDAFTCGDHVDPDRAVTRFVQGLGAQHSTRMEIRRGMSSSLLQPTEGVTTFEQT